MTKNMQLQEKIHDMIVIFDCRKELHNFVAYFPERSLQPGGAALYFYIVVVILLIWYFNCYGETAGLDTCWLSMEHHGWCSLSYNEACPGFELGTD